MTAVADSLISWLCGYPGISANDQVDTDQLGADAASMGLLRAPGRTEVVFIDGSRDVTAYYLFRVRRSAQQNDMRVSNQAWLEEFETWVREQPYSQNLPTLSGGRKCYAVSVSESAYLLDASETDVVYQIGLEITFFEPKILTTTEENTDGILRRRRNQKFHR